MPFKTSALPRTIPSIAASRDAMLESQQGHIDDLVQRNRTLDQTCKKLKEELQREESRAKDAVKDIQTRWQEERVEWREGCDTLLACHRIVQLRTAVELDKERLALVKLDDLMRKEKLARLQRDYKITMFQVKEMEIDNRVAELEDELADLKEQNEDEIQLLEEEHANATQKLLKKSADLSSEVTRISEALSAAQRERDEVEVSRGQLEHYIVTYYTAHRMSLLVYVKKLYNYMRLLNQPRQSSNESPFNSTAPRPPTRN
jgi:predicted  nucleic acid-binding Zn-ribbon protein